MLRPTNCAYISEHQLYLPTHVELQIELRYHRYSFPPPPEYKTTAFRLEINIHYETNTQIVAYALFPGNLRKKLSLGNYIAES